jgi:hypothetical protein
MSDEKTNITLSWSGIKFELPIDTGKAIQELIKSEALKLISNDTSFMKEMINHIMIDHRKVIVELLKPVMKEMFEDKAFSINIKGWWNDE